MSNLHASHRFGRHLVRAAAVAAFTLGLESTTAQAQDEQAPAAKEKLEEITVTGSRIPRREFSSPSPAVVLDSTEIEMSGLSNLSDILFEVPSVAADVTSSGSNSAAGTERAGLNTVSLRDLGTDRTLTLMDGKRIVSNRTGRQQVDISSVPAGFVDRIEVITGGASAIYGSDAIAGVVNIITKKDFEGLAITLKGGRTDNGDRGEFDVGVTAGGMFGEGRGSAMFGLSYSDRDPIYSVDRDYAYQNLEVDPFTGEIIPDYSSSTPNGRYRFVRSTGSVTSTDQFTYDRSTGAYKPGFSESAGDYWSSNVRQQISIPINRKLMATKVEFEANDRLNFYLNGSFSSVNTFTTRNWDVGNTGEFSDEPGYPHIPIDNPFIPAQALAAAPAGALGIRVDKLLTEIPRFTDNIRETFRGIIGADGELAESWKWDAYYSFGRTVQAQYRSGYFVMHNALAAINVVPIDAAFTPTVAAGDSAAVVQGAYQCANVLARTQGCLPVNWFGMYSMDPDSARWISDDTHFRGLVEQRVAAASINGTLYELPAGPLGVAAGFEYREESSQTRTDTLIGRDQVGSSAIPSQEGEMDVSEFFVEAVIPILADAPGAEYLGIEVAYRTADYSFSGIGSMGSSRIGLEYEPVSWLKFRGQAAKAQRAPNLLEAFSAPRQTSITEPPDPCDGVASTDAGTTNTNSTVVSRCRADAGLAGFFANNPGVPWVNDTNFEMNGFNSGNPNLREEEADTVTAGFVFQPVFIEGLSVAVDWYRIEITDAIVNTNRGNTLRLCYGEIGTLPAGNDFCTLFDRDNSGQIFNIDSVPLNADFLLVEGIDVVAKYDMDMDFVGLPGNLALNLNWTHTKTNESVDAVGIRNVEENEVDSPRDKVRFTANYSDGPLRVSWRVKYIGESLTDNNAYDSGFAEVMANGPENYAPNVLNWYIAPSRIYHDLSARWEFGPEGRYELAGGINNLFDKEPPYLLDFASDLASGNGSSYCNSECDTYDTLGRNYFLGIKARF